MSQSSVKIDRAVLKTLVQAAKRTVSYLVQHDTMESGGLCCDTVEFKKALESAQTILEDANKKKEKKLRTIKQPSKFGNISMDDALKAIKSVEKEKIPSFASKKTAPNPRD